MIWITEVERDAGVLCLDWRVENRVVHAASNETKAESHVALLCDELCREMRVDWKFVHLLIVCAFLGIVLRQYTVPL